MRGSGERIDPDALFRALLRVVDQEDSLDHALAEFGENDPLEVARELLARAVETNSSDTLQTAFLLLFLSKSVNSSFLVNLLPLVQVEWHSRHEDLVRLLQDIGTCEVVPALTILAVWVPQGLKDDEFHGLAKDATYAIASTDCPASRDALRQLTYSPIEEVRKAASQLLTQV